MSVRWKPLIILSGLFVVVAMGGLLAFVLVAGQDDAGQILAQAAGRSEGRLGSRRRRFTTSRPARPPPPDADVHEEVAGFYGDWLARADASKRPNLEASGSGTSWRPPSTTRPPWNPDACC